MMHRDTPLVSIVTPSFNSGDFLEQAILSVITQNYPYIEHIVVDGGSTDNTIGILQRYEAAVNWISEPDEGQADALNKGFRRARGEVIGWLNADDTYQPGAIASAVKHLQASPEVDLVYGHYNFVDAGGKVIHRHTTPEFSLERLLYGDAIIPQTSMFFRRHALETVGGVKPHLHYVMDWEFTFRLAMQYNVKRVAKTWANFRITEGTKSVRQPEKFWPEIIAVLQEILQSENGRRFKAQAKDALFMTHLLAGLEFARMNQVEATRLHIERAFRINPVPAKHPAILASGLFKTATYPWHSAFAPHPEAERALDNVSSCLGNSSVERRLLGYLSVYRALRLLRRGNWSGIRAHLSQSGNRLSFGDWFSWHSARLMASALFKP